jgi:hypothetical protein
MGYHFFLLSTGFFNFALYFKSLGSLRMGADCKHNDIRHTYLKRNSERDGLIPAMQRAPTSPCSLLRAQREA